MSVVTTKNERTLQLVLDEEQQMLRSTAKQFVDANAPVGRLRTLRDTKDERGYSAELWSEMAELGWLALQLPEAHEGLGLGFFGTCGRPFMAGGITVLRFRGHLKTFHA